MLEVVADDGPASTVGLAQLAGWLLDGSKPIRDAGRMLATYRLTVDRVELPGLFTGVARRFKLVGSSIQVS